MGCAELETNTAQEIARQLPPPDGKSTHTGRSQVYSRHRKYWKSIAISVGVGAFAGLAWLYYYAVSTLQSALTQFRP